MSRDCIKHCRCSDFVGRFGECNDVMKQGEQKLDNARTTSRFNSQLLICLPQLDEDTSKHHHVRVCSRRRSVGQELFLRYYRASPHEAYS
mmetsp:Transcript_4674/g.11985  ORF Transcript_4674/g.11985 Transcript_4674/m.11985 type:complete len:90 (+) Transcript_4674:2196-2465(+)